MKTEKCSFNPEVNDIIPKVAVLTSLYLYINPLHPPTLSPILQMVTCMAQYEYYLCLQSVIKVSAHGWVTGASKDAPELMKLRRALLTVGTCPGVQT